MLAVVGAAGDGEQAVTLAGERHPDVVLMDLRMPRCDGVEATRRIRSAHPEVQVVILTTFDDDDSIFAALDAGARGYLTKNASAEEIRQAVLTSKGLVAAQQAVEGATGRDDAATEE